MRKCIKCSKSKKDEFFSKKPTICKACAAKKMREYRKKYPERIKKSEDKRKEKTKEYAKNYNIKNKKLNAARWILYYAKNREKIRARAKKHREDNKQLYLERERFNRNNLQAKERIAKHWKIYGPKARADRKKRFDSDPLFRFTHNMRGTISGAFKKRSWSKNTKAHKVIGCDYETAIAHLINTAQKNYGVYDPSFVYEIDHKIPFSTAKNESDIIRLCHYTNLQYLRPEHNRAKKDRLDYEIPV